MRIAIPSLAACLLVALATAADPPPRTAPAEPSDVEDVVFLDEARPVLVRLHVRCDGRPFTVGWSDCLQALFDFLDADHDGSLSRGELGHAPSLAQLREQCRGQAVPETDAPPDFADVDTDPADGKVTLAELDRYYRQAGVGPLMVERAWRAGADPLTDALFRLLDRDGDRKLSRDELASAAFRLLDQNDDDVISTTEILGRAIDSGMTFAMPGDANQPPAAFPLVAVPAGAAEAALGKRLLARYGGGRDKLSREAVGLGREAFERLDADHDGGLDVAELARWCSLPPDFEVAVRLGSRADGADPVGPAAGGAGGKPTPSGGLAVTLPGARLEVIGRTYPAERRQADRKALLELFRTTDADRSGFIESREVTRPPFDRVAILRLADRDGDGRVSADEWAAYVDLQGKLLTDTAVLTLADRGRTLFELLDADHDGRLGPRELLDPWAVLGPWDRDGDGRLARDELPLQLHLVVGNVPRPRAGGDGLAPGYGPARLPRSAAAGPLWFRKMDTNHDGYVSRREFLGPDEEFRRIDADGDGFISREEAEKADPRSRLEKP
jgi:Ca2+-binding EF-hand superfamily protein